MIELAFRMSFLGTRVKLLTFLRTLGFATAANFALMAAHARICMFSGRRDPEWSLSPEETTFITEQLSTLQPTPAHPPQMGELGYRGVYVTIGNSEFKIYRGRVTRSQAHIANAWFLDEGQRLEKLILTSAHGDDPRRCSEHVIEKEQLTTQKA